MVAQDWPQHVTVFSDSDHAGCLKTRKSTSGSMCFFGSHLIRSGSTTQGVVSLSTGESEFYAAVKSTSVGLGMVEMFRDLGVALSKKPSVLVRVDATAGLGIASRRGAGRIRHIATP
eukprot:526719-Amphidinium_carterae.1